MGKRSSRDERICKTRQLWLVLISIGFFALLLGRLFFLQVVRHGYYTRYAEQNQIQREPIPAFRGLIKDCRGEVLVDNVPRFEVVIPWEGEKKVLETIIRVCSFLSLDSTQVMRRFDAWKKRNPGLPFPIITDANKIVISVVRENCDLFPNLRVKARARRMYRLGNHAAHLLGYVGEVSGSELALESNPPYEPGDIVGKTGLEVACEKYLRGEDGEKVVVVNALGAEVGERADLLDPPTAGKTVFLTIDARMQIHLEELVSRWGVGSAVAINVEDGSIVAAVSMPQFDPNRFAIGIDMEGWEELARAEGKPLFNRFLQAAYPPGSTLKIVTSYAALRSEVASPSEILEYCIGVHRFGNRLYGCWKAGGHGPMNLYLALVQSCDSYFFKLGEILDVDELAAAAREFGLGVQTGIDLPGEVEGLVPDRAYYNRRFGKGKWTQGNVLNNAIGQGEYLVTVLQMVRIAAAIANGGYLVTPHVIKAIEGEPEPVWGRRRVAELSGGILRFLRKAMLGVVQDPEGTAHASALSRIAMAGKTGTAQNPHGEDHAWFIGYAPAGEPRVAIAVVIENAGHGGSVAAPVARDFFREYFRGDSASLTRVSPGTRASGDWGGER